MSGLPSHFPVTSTRRRKMLETFMAAAPARAPGAPGTHETAHEPLEEASDSPSSP